MVQEPAPPCAIPPVIERQAVPLEVRERARALYYQGVTRRAIAAQLGIETGTVDTWRKRYKWIGNRRDDPNGLLPTIKPAQLLAIRTQEKEYSLRKKLAEHAEHILANLPKQVPKEARGFKDYSQGFAAITTSISSIEGWSDTSIAVLDLEQLGRDHREIVVTPVTPATSGGQLPSDYQQSPESLGNSG